MKYKKFKKIKSVPKTYQKVITMTSAFYKLVETIKNYSATGCWVDCGDKIRRHIFPLILILAADYEEQ